MIKKYFAWTASLYNEESSGVALSIFRIFYGLVLLGEISQIFYFRHLIFDPVPYQESAAFAITPFMLIWLGSIVFIILGLFTKASAIINYLFTVFVIGFSFHAYPGSLHEYHIDTELITVAFVLIFMPVARRFSLDRLIQIVKYSSIRSEFNPPKMVSVANYFVLTLAAGLIYFDSLFYKYASPMWLSGLGVWLPASQPWGSWLDLNWLLNQKYLMLFLGYLTLFFQTTYIFLVWFKKLKPFYIWLGIGLHIGIFFAFPIPWFALGMVAIYVALIPSETYAKLKNIFFSDNTCKLVFLYDKECPLCNRLRLIVQFFDFRKSIEFKNVQDNSQNFSVLKGIDQKELLDNVYSIDHTNNVYYGINTYQQLMIRVWIFKPLGYLLYLPPVKSIGTLIYNYIAKHRLRYGCNEETCSTSLPAASKPVDTDQIKILQTLSVKDIRIGFLGIFIAFIVFSQLVLIQKSFLMQHIYKKLHMPTEVLRDIVSATNTYQKVVFPLTGLMSHPVFMDFHFKNYRHEISVIYRDGDKSTYLPMIDEKGQALWYDSGRQWVHWSFRVNNLLFKNRKDFETRTNNFLYFWAHKNDIDVSKGNFVIQIKPLDVPYHFEHDHLKSMIARPWDKIAVIKFTENKFAYEWDEVKIETYSVKKE